MRGDVRRAVLAAGLVLAGLPGAARAEQIGFAFTAEDPDGRTMTGRFSYERFTRPGHTFMDTRSGYAGAEYYAWDGAPMRASIRLDGASYVLLINSSTTTGHIEEIILLDGEPGVFWDTFHLQFHPYELDRPYLIISLRDDEGTAIGTHLELPSAFDLEQFERRSITFVPNTGAPEFVGTITSIGPGAPVVPEPTTLALVGPAALLGLAGWRWRRRRQAA